MEGNKDVLTVRRVYLLAWNTTNGCSESWSHPSSIYFLLQDWHWSTTEGLVVVCMEGESECSMQIAWKGGNAMLIMQEWGTPPHLALNTSALRYMYMTLQYTDRQEPWIERVESNKDGDKRGLGRGACKPMSLPSFFGDTSLHLQGKASRQKSLGGKMNAYMICIIVVFCFVWYVRYVMWLCLSPLLLDDNVGYCMVSRLWMKIEIALLASLFGAEINIWQSRSIRLLRGRLTFEWISDEKCGGFEYWGLLFGAYYHYRSRDWSFDCVSGDVVQPWGMRLANWFSDVVNHPYFVASQREFVQPGVPGRLSLFDLTFTSRRYFCLSIMPWSKNSFWFSPLK